METQSKTDSTVVLRWTAVAAVVDTLIFTGAVERAPVPPNLLAAIVVLVGGILVMRGSTRGGAWTATVGFVLMVLMCGPAAVPYLAVPASAAAFAVMWCGLLAGIVGVIAGVGVIRGSTSPGARAWKPAVAVAALAIGVGVVATLAFSNASRRAGDVSVVASHTKFTPQTLTVGSGTVSFFLSNHDTTLHDFTIKGVSGGDVNLPAGHQVRLTVHLAPGTYQYHCDIHDQMKGTITVP